MKTPKYIYCLIVVWALSTLLFSSELPFFWDHISLISNFSSHFYEHGIFPPIIDPIYDHGHPPFFPIYITLFWLIGGKTLFVAHLAMLPILILTAWQWIKLSSKFIEEKYLLIPFIGLLAEPSFLAQSTMISGEIALLLGVLLSLNGILEKNNKLLFLGLLICGLLSIRGSVWCIILYLSHIAYIVFTKSNANSTKLKSLLSLITPYFIAAVFILGWYIYHYVATGYLLASPNSIWADMHQWNFTSANLIYQLKMLIWCIGDFGRFLMFTFLFLILLFSVFKKQLFDLISNNEKILLLLIFLVQTCLVFFPIMIFRAGMLRRYLIPFYLISILFLVFLALKLFSQKTSFSIIGLAFILMFTGHFWVYPLKYAQDWDASLAHLPYFSMEQEMKNYIDENNISFSEIATDFPTYTSRLISHLDNDSRKMNPIRKKASSKNGTVIKPYTEYKYVLYSNIHNRLLEHEYKALHDNDKWQMIKRLEKRNVFIELFQQK